MAQRHHDPVVVEDDELDEDQYETKVPSKYRDMVNKQGFEKLSRSDDWW